MTTEFVTSIVDDRVKLTIYDHFDHPTEIDMSLAAAERMAAALQKATRLSMRLGTRISV